jgi:hypothetical protein
VIQFGIYLPGMDSGTGYAVSVKIIHETVQYLQAAQPAVVTQTHSADSTYGDYWSGQIDLNTATAPPGTSAFGQAPYTFLGERDSKWKTPPPANPIIYQLMISEFRDELCIPTSGDYVEEIGDTQNLVGVVTGVAQPLRVPSNYGCVSTIS